MSADFYLQLLKDKNPHARKKAAETLAQFTSIDKASLARLKAAFDRETDSAVKETLQSIIATLESVGN